MRSLVRAEVDVAAPMAAVWSYVTDWPRQAEWIPFSRVEVVERPHAVGGRIRGWTGVGPVGFWDPMTITALETTPGEFARCEVLHTGRLVRGEAEFSVRARGDDACTFMWWENLQIPGGPVGALGWRVLGPVAQRLLRLALRRMARRVERRTPRSGRNGDGAAG